MLIENHCNACITSVRRLCHDAQCSCISWLSCVIHCSVCFSCMYTSGMWASGIWAREWAFFFFQCRNHIPIKNIPPIAPPICCVKGHMINCVNHWITIIARIVSAQIDQKENAIAYFFSVCIVICIKAKKIGPTITARSNPNHIHSIMLAIIKWV